MDGLFIFLTALSPFYLVFVLFLVLTTGEILYKVTLKVIIESPRDACNIFISSVVGACWGYIKDGYISIEIPLFGFLGFLMYLLYILIKKDSLEL